MMTRSFARPGTSLALAIALALAVAPVLFPSRSDAQSAAAPRRIWADSSTDMLRPSMSPDGRFLAFTDWVTGDLAIRDLSLGQNRRLTNKGGWDKSSSFAISALLSPDGKSVAYSWFRFDEAAMAAGSPGTTVEVRVMSVDGTNDRKLVESRGYDAYIAATDWSRDGSMVVVAGTDESARGVLMMVPVNGGVPREIKRFPDYRSPDARISPNGRYVAYSYQPRRTDSRNEVYLFALESGRTTTVREAGDANVIGWIDDGQLALWAVRGGSPGVWKLRVDGGEPKGAPTLVRRDLWRSEPGRLTADGKYVYGVRSGDQEVYIASFDGAGRLRAAPIPISGQPGQQHGSPRWSSDGKYVAFVTQERREPIGTSVTIYSVSSGERRVLRPAVVSLRHAMWIPQSRTMSLKGSDDKGRTTLFRYDLQTGNLAVLLPEPGTVTPTYSRDGRRLYYVPPRGPGPARTLVARDLASGAERELFAVPEGSEFNAARARIVESEDGRWIAASTQITRAATQFSVLPAAGGQSRTIPVPGTGATTYATLLGFSRDAQQLIYSLHGPNTNRGVSLWKIPVAGGEPRAMEVPKDIRAPSLSPDGSRLVYWAGGISPEIWLMDEPALRANGTGGRASRR